MQNLIKINCPNCRTEYKISPDKLPEHTKIKLNCKKCGTSFKFMKPESEEKKEQKDIISENDITAEDQHEKTIIRPSFSGQGGTAPDVLPKDCEIVLTYKVDDKEIRKDVDKRLTIIGRTEGDIKINDSLISRKHASIEVKSPTMVELKDLASTNGTFHNDMKITSVYLQSGDIIKVGSTTIHFSSHLKFT